MYTILSQPSDRQAIKKPVAKQLNAEYYTIALWGFVGRLVGAGYWQSPRVFCYKKAPTMNKLISSKIISDELDILELEIVDFNRLNGHFGNQREALSLVGFLLMDLARVTVIEVPDFWDIPNRNDFPGWRHVGHHPKVGKQFWNWFHHWNPGSELYLADGPDLCGVINGALFFGDIGKVSASTFIMSLKSMSLNDVWISVSLDGTKQTIIEYVAGGRQYTPSERPIPIPAKPFVEPFFPTRPRIRPILSSQCQQLELF